MYGVLRSLTRFFPYTKWTDLYTGAVPCAKPRLVAVPASDGWPRLELDLHDPWQRQIFLFPRAWGRYYRTSSSLGRFLEHLLEPGDGFLDIGANLGYFTFLAAQRVGPEGAVWAFEPEPAAYGALERTARLNELEHVRCFNLAVAERAGKLTFHRSRDGRASSLLPEVGRRARRYANSIDVDVVRLDDGTHQLDPARLKVVKIDVEGAEDRVVAGMLETLRAASHPRIWCEVRGPRGSTRAAGTFARVAHILRPLGYRPTRWLSPERQEDIDVDDVALREDVLFVH